MNPRTYNFQCDSWNWNTKLEVVELKTKATVIKAGTIVDKDDTGKIDAWNISSSTSTGALYIMAEDTVKDVDRGVCISAGEVLKSALQYPTSVQWNTLKDGVSILDSMNSRSQIRLIS